MAFYGFLWLSHKNMAFYGIPKKLMISEFRESQKTELQEKNSVCCRKTTRKRKVDIKQSVVWILCEVLQVNVIEVSLQWSRLDCKSGHFVKASLFHSMLERYE
jgi:hypothetical protein